jgi:hypothetical protein
MTAPVGDPLPLDDLGRRDLRRAERADLARVNEIGQRAQHLVDVSVRIRNPHLVQVDPVCLQPLE